MEKREVLYIHADGCRGGGRESGFCQSLQIQKQVGAVRAAPATHSHSKAYWLGDLRVNNTHQNDKGYRFVPKSARLSLIVIRGNT